MPTEREWCSIHATCDRIAQRMGGRFVLDEDQPMTDTREPVARDWMKPVPILPGDKSQTVWFCKIGVLGTAPTMPGADGPMRRAAELKFRAVTGRDAEFCFSGWGGKLDECELAVVENRLPEPAAIGPDADLMRQLVEARETLIYIMETSDDEHVAQKAADTLTKIGGQS